jgi:hypothetical protein
VLADNHIADPIKTGNADRLRVALTFPFGIDAARR